MCYLRFDKTLMGNLQESMPRELLRTNNSGAYHCTTIADCNTRKYHGLLVIPVPELDDENHVLLSSLDETVIQHGAEFNLGLHKYQGDNYSPNGHKYIREFECEKVPTTIYRVGGVILKKEKLFVPAGKAISGEPISISITSMPHCLISGATNSGKSVCANSIICSLLLNYKPDELKMIMVDPKKVEMLFYTNLPHLLCPIITESSKALVALDKLVKEMMNRFDTFASLGVKNIGAYNEYKKQKNEAIMPFIVLIVDEFAELMAYRQSNLVEEKVQTLVQLGRAAGIHLILCTQRPSVNVITGTIKNNIPCRMTFRLSSFADSKTVIDGSGAEKLLNNGDMLLLTPDFTGLRRIQGAFVSDQEIDDIVAYCKKQCAPLYAKEFLDLRTEEEKEFDLHTKINSGNTNEEENSYNAKYMDVRNFVLMEQKASTTLIQRKFKIGYGKAANYMDMLEDEGIVGPENGSKGREVLMTFEEWEAKNESENN